MCCDGDVFRLQLGDVKEASQTYDKAVKQTGGDAPGLYKLMGQLARHSTVPGSGVSVETLESSLAPAESLPAGKLDDLEEAAPGDCLQATLLACTGLCHALDASRALAHGWDGGCSRRGGHAAAVCRSVKDTVPLPRAILQA